MLRSALYSLLKPVIWFEFGLLNVVLFVSIFFRTGAYFKKNTEQDDLQLAIERDRFWNLSKEPITGFKHYFHALPNDLKLHYISNREPGYQPGTLVIFLHGFPDSCIMWRHLMKEPNLHLTNATFVCVDLPGYGGSDSLEKYDTEVLEALTDFIVAMREQYLDSEDQSTQADTLVVGHDWGAVIGFRLASEAPSLADRFILMNGPHIEMALANMDRILQSSSKIFKQFRQSPRKNFGCLSKSLHTMKPLFKQILMFGYIFAFHLPIVFVNFLGTTARFAFLRGAHASAHGKDRKLHYREAESLACTFGPSVEECKTSTTSTRNGYKPQTYGNSVGRRVSSPSKIFWNMTGYYRDGVGTMPWTKSLETIANLHALESDRDPSSPTRRRSSFSSGSLFVEQYKGSLRAPALVLWGEQDQACTRPLCLDGVADYLAKDSEVIILPRSGHWTPVESESRLALATATNLYASKGALNVPNITDKIKGVYKGAQSTVKK